MTPDRRHFFDEPRNLRRTLRLFGAVCVVLLLLDFVFIRDGKYGWEDLFGFYAVFGFVACVGLVLAAKQLRKVVMRDEDYYGDR